MHGKIPKFRSFRNFMVFIGRPFFDEVFNRFLSSNVKKRHFFLEKECFEVFARNFTQIYIVQILYVSELL